MRKAIEDHLTTVRALLEHVPLLEEIVQRIDACFKNGGKLYIIGNGGSAADAQHISAELLGRFKVNRRALPAIALTTDTSTLTAVCNDLGGDLIFSRQVEALVTKRDILWALSVSGSSPNIIAAVKVARQAGATVIGFTSTRGKALAELSDLCLQAAHTASDRVQEVHLLAYHLICERIEQMVAQASAS